MKQNYRQLLEAYQRFVSMNRDVQPAISEIELPKLQHTYQYVGAQIIGDELYAIANSAESIMRYNTRSGAFAFLGDLGTRDFKWTGGCVYDGKLYLYPRAADELLIYDPASSAFGRRQSGRGYDTEHHYGGVCTADGIVYQPPRRNDYIQKWDLKNNICSKIYVKKGEQCSYHGSIIHPNGYIYMIPNDGYVIKLDPDTDEFEYIGEKVIYPIFDPAIAYDGNIYGFTQNKGILKIDAEQDTVQTLHDDIGFMTYATKTGVNGCLYSFPGYTNELWEYEPVEDRLRKKYAIDTDCSIIFAGGAVDTNGDMYALPVFEHRMLKLSFGGAEIPADIHSAFFADSY